MTEELTFKKLCENKLKNIFASTCKDCGGEYKECLSIISFEKFPVNKIFDLDIYEEDVPEGSEFVGKRVPVIKISNNKVKIKDTNLFLDYKPTFSICYCKHTAFKE